MTLGPKQIGTWSDHVLSNSGSAHDFLQPREFYAVIKEFADHDRHMHAVGETWCFLGYSFLPYDDGMSFFVSFDGEAEWQIRLQWRAEEQAHVLDNLSEYVIAIEAPSSV
jgi:hypothetical protein